MKEIKIALAGNPNVGKSTLFNALTGLSQHTGNWAGKTVDNAMGTFTYKDCLCTAVDLPGTYSLLSPNADERITEAYIRSGEADITVLVADATCLLRNISLILQLQQLTENIIVCVNLMDEARKKKIHINTHLLSQLLHTPVIPMSARAKDGIEALKECICAFDLTREASDDRERQCAGNDVRDFVAQAGEIYKQCVTVEASDPHALDRKLDRIVTSRLFGIPIMLVLLMLIFWITIVGANYPSMLLSDLFAAAEPKLRAVLSHLNATPVVTGVLIDGIYKTLAWVISVMLPPMAIFFPLFTLLEDFGYLPRVAFNMDRAFQKCRSCGKQCLTMMMGFGCNACAIIGCRIIDSPRERLIAILTNSFVPCNGRFPTLIALSLIFFVSGAASSFIAGLMLTGFILLGIGMTLLISRLLSQTLLKGVPSSFTLELPPYRMPKVKDVVIRSLLDRTLFVLGRAVLVAAPAGLLIWILANYYVGDSSLLAYCTGFLDPFGKAIGLDGVIIMAFLLGFPANEIVVPIIIMTYLSQGYLIEFDSLSDLKMLLIDNGWTRITAICTMLLCLFHFPCGTTCFTIYKETQSVKWTLASFFIPACCGVAICFCVTHTAALFA